MLVLRLADRFQVSDAQDAAISSVIDIGKAEIDNELDAFQTFEALLAPPKITTEAIWFQKVQTGIENVRALSSFHSAV